MNSKPHAALAALLLTAFAAQADGPPDRRSVSVSGHGEVAAAPDRARLSMSVEITKLDLRAAQAEVNRIVRDYLAKAKALGIKDEDLSTAGLSIRAEYDYTAKPTGNNRRFVGYHVSRGIEVVVRDLDKIGDALLRATDAGINEVSDPQLESSKADELQRQALAKAADGARAKARVLAEALGVGLGSVHTLNANTEYSPPPVPRGRLVSLAAQADNGGGNEQLGFAAGQIKFGATLNADFDLISP